MHFNLRAAEDLRILDVLEFIFLIERLSWIAGGRADLLELIEVGAAGFETLIVFVIKRIVFKGRLVVGLVREVSASKVGFIGVWAIVGLLKCVASFEWLVSVVISCIFKVVHFHGKTA